MLFISSYKCCELQHRPSQAQLGPSELQQLLLRQCEPLPVVWKVFWYQVLHTHYKGLS